MVTYELFTDKGERLHNEDQVGVERFGNEYGFFLADGLGGCGNGDAASFIAVEEAKVQFFQEGAAPDCIDRIFHHAQNSIRNFQKTANRAGSMRTTFCALLISEIDIRWAHIGDSRIYYFRDGVLTAQTKDQSVPQMLAASGLILPSQIRFHPDRNRLLECMGSEWDGIPYECAVPVGRGGRQDFLLCSDGFWEWIDEKEMEQCLLTSDSPETWMREMVQIAGERGAGNHMDNFSAVTVWCRS